MAAPRIWVPALVFAHAFAFFWLLKALLRARPGQQAKKRTQGGSDQSVANCGNGSAAMVPKGSQVVSLEWQALGCRYNVRGTSKIVLQDVWGQAQPGQMQALMGPSGAGKSTLMDMLAMRKSVGNLTGRLLVNGQPATSSFIAHTSYVPQDDTFIPTQTSQETLAFYARVTLGAGWSHSSRKGRVAEVLDAVGLGHAADTLVGGTLPGGLHLRGLSGGERRRLSIAAGILRHPLCLFLDEPTSGLDSFAALIVMGHLQRLAQSAQQTVIATIHQPRSDIWEMFDQVSLLSSGRLMFHGRCADILPWFKSLGYTHTRGSASDWVLDLVATGFIKPDPLFGHTMRTMSDIDAAADAFKARSMKVARTVGDDNKDDIFQLRDESPFSADASITIGSQGNSVTPLGNTQSEGLQDMWLGGNNTSYATSWWSMFKALFMREMAGATRNPFDVAARVLTCTYVALLVGVMAYDADFFSAAGLLSRINYIFAAVLMMMLLPYISISLYTSDKSIYLADVSAKTYRPSAYYMAKVLVTLPFNLISSLCFSSIIYGMAGLHPGGPQFARFACIISIIFLICHQVLHLCAAISPNYDICFALSVGWTTVQEVFCGFFISFSIVSARMQWLTQLRYIAASYFALEALLINEHTDTWMDCSNGLAPSQINTLTTGLVNATSFQNAMIRSLGSPRPGCLFKEDVLLSNMGFGRPFGVSVAILLGYLGVLHVLTFAGLLLTARRERR